MNIEEIPYIARYYDVILRDNTIFDEIKKKYPELEIDLLSSRDNPNCECKQRVINYLTTKLNVKEDEFFLTNLINSDNAKKLREEINENWKFIIEQETFKQQNVSLEFSSPGKIYKVEKSDEAWLEFITKIRASLQFQSFSVVDKETYLEVYFI
jgi:hypothetical protein